MGHHLKTDQKKKVKNSFSSRFFYIIDAGHGSLSPGKRYKTRFGGYVFREYLYNRKVKDELCEMLDNYGISYIDLVPENNVSNILKTRIKRAEDVKTDKPKILISIHFNAGPGEHTTAEGIETWYRFSCLNSKKIAGIFQQNLIYYTRFKSRGIKSKKEKEFYILRKFKGYAAILTENGFFNNPNEVKEIMKKETINKIAIAHMEAIKEIEGI